MSSNEQVCAGFRKFVLLLFARWPVASHCALSAARLVTAYQHHTARGTGNVLHPRRQKIPAGQANEVASRRAK